MSGKSHFTNHKHRRNVKWKNFRIKLRESYGAKQYQNQLLTSFLNVDGLSDASLEDVKSYASLRSPDFIFLLESKRRMEEVGSDISVAGYDLTEIRRSDAANDKQGGGIACYTKNIDGVLFKRHSPDIAHEDLAYVDAERVWMTVETQHSKTAVCGLYLGCQFSDDRNNVWNQGILWVLQQEVTHLCSQGYRIQLVGDFNSHIGNLAGQGIEGNNANINKNGERFISFLMDNELSHVNGALKHGVGGSVKLCTGLWTRQRGNSRTVIDYVALSNEHLDSIVSMNIDENGVYGGGSDHNWVEITMVDKFVKLSRIIAQPKKKEVWNIQEDQDWSTFQAAVLELLPDGDSTHLSVDELASLVATILRSAGVSSIGYKAPRTNKSHYSHSLPHHLVIALKIKRSLAQNWKTLSSSNDAPTEEITAAEAKYVDQSAVVDGLFQCHQFTRRAKKWGSVKKEHSKRVLTDFWAAVTGKVVQPSEIRSVLSSSGVLKTDVDDICREVEKHLCGVFQGSMNPIDPPECPQSVPDHEHLAFKSGMNSDTLPDHSYSVKMSPKLPKIGNTDELEKNPSNWLARDFSTNEIKKIAAKLSNGKAKGLDNIPSEFLKYSPPKMFELLTLLFNKVKNSGTFPSGWNCGRITLIFKRGLRAKLGNYRPITVIIALSGFYSKLLNDRLIEVVERFSLLGEMQNGFRKERGGFG